MNGWVILGWVVSALLIVIAGFLIYLVIVGFVRGIRDMHRNAKLARMNQEKYRLEARAVAKQLYTKDSAGVDVFGQVEAFRAGADWAWGAHRRK